MYTQIRRTPKQDIEYVSRIIEKTYEKASTRYFYRERMSSEFANILISIGVSENNPFEAFAADDETYLKAIEILKIVVDSNDLHK